MKVRFNNNFCWVLTSDEYFFLCIPICSPSNPFCYRARFLAWGTLCKTYAFRDLYQFLQIFRTHKADRPGRLLDPYPTTPSFVCFPLLDAPAPAILPFDTPSATSARLGLVQFALCDRPRPSPFLCFSMGCISAPQTKDRRVARVHPMHCTINGPIGSSRAKIWEHD
jgi:hypothetical protein